MRTLVYLFGLLCVAIGALLGLFALFGYFVSKDATGRVVAGVLGAIAVLMLVFGARAVRHRPCDAKKRAPPDLPTEKQRRYAAKIGIDVPPTMSKAELSAAIADAERRNPALAEQRERVKRKVRERKFGSKVIDEEDRWNRFADEVGYMLAVYTRGKETIVDVLRVNEAYIDDHGKLKLGVESPKVVRDRYIGDYLDWDKHFELPIESLLYHEPLHSEFHYDGNDAYRKVVEKGLKIASKL